MAIHIGCSGWHYLHWRGDFYPAQTKSADFLQLYRKQFNTVELNNSFYRLPTEKALLAWRDSVPADFRFAVKASRFITHNKKLKDSGESFRMFFDRITLLGDRLGPILFQLPPRWNYNGDRLNEFLATLPPSNDYVFEFRNRDWLREEAFTLLRNYNVGFCVHDIAECRTPDLVTGDLAYVRFHGPVGNYQGGYSDSALEDWAVKLLKWEQENKQVYVYFNNDIGGFAPRNALTLIQAINNKK